MRIALGIEATFLGISLIALVGQGLAYADVDLTLPPYSVTPCGVLDKLYVRLSGPE
jgi:hypothetical protein